MTELDKLENYLKEKGLVYSREDVTNKHGAEEGEMKWDWHQLKVFEHGRVQWDAICHRGSYGYEKGLLEVMGEALIGDDDVRGWLTADDVIKMIEGGDANE